ncbi:MAG: hypothetical protein ACPGRC_08635 [Salibacteraceae bacterium]
MSKILVIGDSLAAQRPEDDIKESERWPKLFAKKTGACITNLSKGFSTTQRLVEQSTKIAAASASATIIQLGVVDCAPRRFKRWEMKFIYKLPKKWQTKTINFLKKRRTQSLDKCYVSPSDFKKNISQFVSSLVTPVYYVQILPASNTFKAANPQIEFAIRQYNGILNELETKFSNLKVIEIPENEVEQLTLDDGYHLNRLGHLAVSEKLCKLQPH